MALCDHKQNPLACYTCYQLSVSQKEREARAKKANPRAASANPLLPKMGGESIIVALRGDTDDQKAGADYVPPPKRPEISDRRPKR